MNALKTENENHFQYYLTWRLIFDILMMIK